MPLTLTSGGESRLDGAPDQLLPPFADSVEALAQAILADDTDNVYGGDINLARQIARQRLGEMSDRSRAGQAAAAQAGADRDRTRAARQGVSPESLPMDEYGAVSGRTVQEANRPLPEAEAALGREREAADAIIRGLREGTPVFGPQGDLDFLRERGERNPLEPNGRTDMAMRARIRERRGQFSEMPDGTRIPVGAEPTDAQIRAERGFQEWANKTPGTERQALYDPEAYEEFREGVRNDIRDRAQDDMTTYGTGPDDNGRRARLRLPPLTADQETRRADRAESENRVRQAQRGRFYEDKLMVDAGITPPKPGPDAGIQDLERAAFRGRYARRQAELDRRKQNRIDQAMMAGGQPTGGPFGTRATTTAINQLGPGWREIALLDRLTNGRVGGPTPLGVDAVGAQNALRFLNNEAIAGMDPLKRQQAQAMLDMQRRQNMPELAGQADIAAGNPQTPEAVAHLNSLAGRFDDTYFGFSYENEMALAAELQKPPYNMPQAEAEATAYRLAEKRRWLSGGTPGGRPRAGAAPAAPPPPPPGEGGPSGLDFAPPGGDMSF
jgi:hypothetical protein